MKINKKIILLICAMIFSINIVSAETGTLIISAPTYKDSYTYGYSDGNAPLSLTSFKVDSANYNLIFGFQAITTSNGFQFTTENSFSDFNVVSGLTCSGSPAGTSYFNKTANRISWIFNGCTITDSMIRIAYTDSSYTSKIGNTQGAYGDNAPADVDRPVYMVDTSDRTLRSLFIAPTTYPQLTYSANVGYIVQNNYTVLYSMLNNIPYFSVNVTKQTIQTKITAFNGTNVLGTEPIGVIPFTYFGVYPTTGGLSLNMSIADGRYVHKLINSTSLLPDVSLYSYSINFNKTVYGLGDAINFSYAITDTSSLNNIYYIKTYQTEKATGNYYTDAYSVGPTYSGYIVPSVYTNMVSDFEACVMQNNKAVYCKLAEYGYATNATVSGNISINKASYNLSEIVQITYNISTNGRIFITQGFTTLYESYTAIGGYYPIINGKVYYTVNSIDTRLTYVRLQYLLNSTWVTLDTKTYTTKDETGEYQNIVYFETDTINQGEQMVINHIQNQSVYLVLKDSKDKIKFNYSYPSSSGFLVKDYYIVLQSDKAFEIWNAYLYDLSMNVLSWDSIYVNEGIITTPTPLPTITPVATIGSLLDAASLLSDAVIGKQTDEDGVVTDIQIKKTGNQLYGILLMVVILCLIATTYYTITNQRKK